MQFNLIVGIDLNSLNGVVEGNQVTVYSENTNGNWLGTVRRISQKLDAETQMVNVYIAVAGENLKEGMFLNANVQLKRDVFGLEIPRKLLVDSESVFTVNNGIIEQQKVVVVQKKKDVVVVEGLEDGVQLVLKTSGVHKGIAVTTREL
ncbi:hypothetical protein BZG02_19915 [Labilibaculum filiforme]|uniref:RND efflux pump membrane fusion protein barrel-sandwich domain-containing protein n=1 Tax=Labilibaculum filiforme TaxID=1940526 RepID=A0A2N3HQF1_9BACT|nr:hypothetical protein [Labilibaculum filiforme]PKQ60267.1 hypothetical protein BZG02_19915 [Labilibaculum filiforme]